MQQHQVEVVGLQRNRKRTVTSFSVRFSHFSFSYLFDQYSTVFLITLHGPDSHGEGDTEEGEHLMGDGLQAATSYEDGANGISEVVHGIDVGCQIGPVGHRTDRGEET